MIRKLSRSWDDFDAYLFDIDGTLLNCQDAVHYFAFCNALSAIGERPLNLDGVVTHGNTDLGILRDAFRLGQVNEVQWRTRLDEIYEQMGSEVEANREDFRINVLPGVQELLAHLRSRGKVLSTATGNLARVGIAKLEACGLWSAFDLGGWSDGFETRADVFRAALAGVRARVGAGGSVCVLGDTPADIQAAHENGLEVIAVATGIFAFEQLQVEKPEMCVRELTELMAVGVGRGR